MNNNPQRVGTVLDIQRFSLHDGPGIRTTVFLKGCPLRCLWCHNPESMDFRPEIGWHTERCTGCGACIEACPEGCHQLSKEGQLHRFDRAACTRCERCVEACAFDALRLIGKRMNVDDVMAEVLKDLAYYTRSGGGLTLSGGEPLAQPEFAEALLSAARFEGIHTAVETAGQVSFQTLENIVELTDLFLFDLKETDPVRHETYTGVDGQLIRENLQRLDALGGADIILRCPIIPTLNDRPDHFAQISELANSLQHIRKVDLMPYHPFAAHKHQEIGKPNPLRGIDAPTETQKEQWKHALQGSCPVHI
ncbi:glycyl-radical enzyme activating protein [Pontiella sulfatireligans]|uniref:Benzylsuccinate synthase activating enzyme n=1 Tax=Pontiella sulfatireligans TaxID=2750658 RepID=A0A6C2UJV3_9BACT|nr:glycyl-radical enzyme activating protein [Pontiella sulfatireligans]VGO19594.1 Benzylsuccinate synthase activating enzyme [Pontiella sulfatireligans]